MAVQDGTKNLARLIGIRTEKNATPISSTVNQDEKDEQYYVDKFITKLSGSRIRPPVKSFPVSPWSILKVKRGRDTWCMAITAQFHTLTAGNIIWTPCGRKWTIRNVGWFVGTSNYVFFLNPTKHELGEGWVNGDFNHCIWDGQKWQIDIATT